MSYGADTAALQALEQDPAKRQQALDAATLEIDQAIASSPRQYRTPIDLSAIADTDMRSQVEALVDIRAEAIAAYYLSRGSAGTGAKVRKDYETARTWLKSVSSGKVEIPGLPLNGSNVTVAVVGTRQGDFRQEIFDAVDRMVW